jgi:RNA polymerase sporulation-specific sigma factor
MDHTKELILQAHQGDKQARESLVKENMGLVWSIARKFAAMGHEMEDMVQIGSIGLLKSIDRFDLTQDVRFSTYAVPMIIGEIRRFLRDDGLIKVSRTLKENQYKINRAAAQLALELGREPVLEEIAESTGISVEDILLSKEALQEVGSIYQTAGGDENDNYMIDRICTAGVSCQEDGTPEDEEKTAVLNHMMLEKLLSGLGERERRLICLRYYENQTQTATAQLMGMTQVQVSRLEKKILLELRAKTG